MAPDYIWRQLRSEDVFTGPFYRVTKDRLLHPHGHDLDYFVIRYNREAVGIIAEDKQGRVLMVQQWRHPVQKLLWEVPAGGVDAGESPPQAAARELREETGYIARDITPLYRYHPSIGSSSQTFNLFVGREIEQVGQPDPVEIHAIRWFTPEEVEGLVSRGELVDGMSLVTVLCWLRRLGR